jgi:ferric-dicitrate binding protein FerR (iron transport regulator)
MTCKNYQPIFDRYMEGILPPTELEDLREHMKTCPACRAAFQEFSHMQTLVQDSLKAPASGREKIAKVIADTEIGPPMQHSSRTPLSRFWGYSAAAAVFLVIGLFVGSRYASRPVSPQKPLAISISNLQGDVLIRHPWEDGWKKLTAEESVYKGDAFVSLHQASIVLVLDENNTVTLNENSALDLLEYNGQAEFKIPYGTVKATLKGPHEPFFISTPQGRFQALGTEFIVRVQ